MSFIVRRCDDDDHATIGDWFIQDEWTCHTLEDTFREIKIPGETRIPAGRYRLELKDIGMSRFDAQFKRIFGDLYLGMIRLVEVPDFTQVLIHCGNTEEDTAGCILLGERQTKDANDHHAVSRSVAAMRTVYPIVSKAIRAGDTYLDVVDGDRYS